MTPDIRALTDEVQARAAFVEALLAGLATMWVLRALGHAHG